MTLQANLPIECLPDDTTGKTAYRVSAGCHNWQVCLASVCRMTQQASLPIASVCQMTQQASLPSECLPDHTTGKSAYRVSSECLPDDTTGKSA